MIVVTDVSIIEARRDPIEWLPPNKYKSNFDAVDKEASDIDIESEIVNGRKFNMPGGKTVLIGLTQKIQDVLGLPMEAFENQEREINQLYSDLASARLEICRLEGLGFWDRLRSLFLRR